MDLNNYFIPARVAEFNSYLLSSELKKIKNQSMEEYFVWLLNKKTKIPNSINSIVLYCMGITDNKPTDTGLKVKKKGSMADIDLDIERGLRSHVISAITGWFGSDCVVPLITYTEMGSKIVLNDAGRVHGIDPSIRDSATSYIKVRQGKTDSIAKSLEISPELRALQKQYPQWFALAEQLEGNIRHVGVHPSGIVVSARPLKSIMPLAYNSSLDIPTTQWDMTVIDELGLTKIDVLGLETLDIAHSIIDQVRSLFKIKIDLKTIPLNDAVTWDLIKTGRTLGVFQIESRMMRGMCRKVQPNCLKDLMLISSIGRPGPMAAIQFGGTTLDQFISRKEADEYSDYHPDLHEVLKASYGLIVYQEDVMEASRVLAGYDEVEQDKLRKIIGKKLGGEFDKLKIDYKNRALANGYNEAMIDSVINISSDMSSYGFNRAHCCTYSMMTYAMAYLKTHYPTCTFISFFNSHSIQKKKKDIRSKLPEFVNDAKHFGIRVYPPDINLSKLQTSLEGVQSIRLGIKSINGFRGEQKKLLEMQQRGPFKSIFDLMVKSTIDTGSIKALIMCGACDSFISSREEAMALVDVIADTFAKHKLKIKRQVENLEKYKSGGPYQSERIANGKKDDSADKLNKAIAAHKELVDYDVSLDLPKEVPYVALSDEDKARAEIELLGLCLTINPFDKFEAECKRLITHNICTLMPDDHAIVGGFIQGITWHLTKTGKQMAYIWLQDNTSAVEITIFPKLMNKVKEWLVPGNTILVKGNMNQDEDFMAFDVLPVEKVAETKKF